MMQRASDPSGDVVLGDSRLLLEGHGSMFLDSRHRSSPHDVK